MQVARLQVQYLRQWLDEKAPPAQVAKGEPPRVQVDYLRSYRFVEEMGVLTQVALIAASCCAGPIRSLVVVVVVACCCCIPYRLALMLALTFAPCALTFAPCTLTFAPCAYGVSLLSTGATIPLAQMVVVTSCNLRWWCFILQPLAQIVHLHTWWFTLCNLRWWCFFIQPLAQILYLHLGNLHCVVVVSGGGRKFSK